MRITRRRILAAMGTTGTLIATAGCLGDDSTDADADDGGADDSDDGGQMDGSGDGGADGGEASTPTVAVRSHPDHGDVLVDAEGMTLYNFDADERGAGESACDGDCLDAWPPLTLEDDPVAGDGVAAALSTFERDDGTTQVAANGWPLYYFASDEEPGDAAGQGANDVWWVLRSDGTPVRSTADEPDATVTVGPDGDVRFDPETLEIEPGATVEFAWDSGGHNVAVEERPDDAEWEGVEDVQDAGYTHRHAFDVAGRYEYVCEPHESAGMTGTIVVGDGDA